MPVSLLERDESYRGLMASMILDTGVGPHSKAIHKHLDMARDKINQVATTKLPLDRMIEALQEIREEASEPNWDGYDAEPISDNTYYQAREMLLYWISSYTLLPELSPEPDGGIGFEWYKKNKQVFVISVDGSNEVTYAGIFGLEKEHGVVPYTPDGLSKLFNKISSRFPAKK
ncbi:MAG: hypothetical protein JRI95_00175 [Deltaproteobacteria bacterium]|nr:hypothetical protein [Deltaproteobacteria bacterium]